MSSSGVYSDREGITTDDERGSSVRTEDDSESELNLGKNNNSNGLLRTTPGTVASSSHPFSSDRGEDNANINVVDEDEDDDDDSGEDDGEIDDAGLLRSMLRDSVRAPPVEEEDEKQCWVCFANEQDDPSAVWVHPCRCRGTTKWVHQACIQRWVDEKQKGNNLADVECPQCATPYVIKFPRSNLLVAILDATDNLVHRCCPVIAGAVCIGSIYWTCVTFGAVTLMQTVGHDQGLVMMERSDPLFLLVSLPLVPVGLVLGKMVRWEEPVLRFLRSSVPKLPLGRYVLPAFARAPARQALQSSLPPMSDPLSITRTFCGALFFPTVATFLGEALYNDHPTHIQRTVMGGLTFVVAKGLFKVYHKQHTYLRQCQRVIMDYEEAEQQPQGHNQN